MFDTSDGEVWTDLLIGEDWKEYNSDTIYRLKPEYRRNESLEDDIK
jgi:hypothetical protein